MILTSNNQHVKQIIERYYMFKFHMRYEKEEQLNKFVLNCFHSLNYGKVKRKDYEEIKNIIKYYNDKN